MTREAQISACPPRTTLNASAISDSSAMVQENESMREVPPKPIMTSRSLLVRQIDHLLFGDWIRGTCHVGKTAHKLLRLSPVWLSKAQALGTESDVGPDIKVSGVIDQFRGFRQ